jgi:hypothetical protein
MKFDYEVNFKETDFRAHPELYRIGKGEQGVLSVEPYKSEILPHWRFKTPDIARVSAEKIYELYERYKAAGDFVGMDMARKFLQMGWTRAMRYAKHRTGKKYIGPVPDDRKGQSGAWGREVAPLEMDEVKLESAKIFRAKLEIVKADPAYIEAVRRHREKFDPVAKPRRKAKTP